MNTPIHGSLVNEQLRCSSTSEIISLTDLLNYHRNNHINLKIIIEVITNNPIHICFSDEYDITQDITGIRTGLGGKFIIFTPIKDTQT